MMPWCAQRPTAQAALQGALLCAPATGRARRKTQLDQRAALTTPRQFQTLHTMQLLVFGTPR
jgi:hypothetical protein